jgi:hypothetical protein
MDIFPAVGDGLMLMMKSCVLTLSIFLQAPHRRARLHGLTAVRALCRDRCWAYQDALDSTGWNTCPVKRWRHVCLPGPARRRWQNLPPGGHSTMPGVRPTVSAREYPGQWRPVPDGGQRRYFTLAFSHRDRLLQADRLIDCTENSIGPEPGTEYVVKLIAQSTGARSGRWPPVTPAFRSPMSPAVWR